MFSERLPRICLVILTIIAVGQALAYTRTIMIPFVLAIFLALVIEPLIGIFQVRLKLPRPLAVTLGLFSLALGGLLSIFLIGSGIRQLLDNADLYQERFVAMSDTCLSLLGNYGLVSLNKEKSIEDLAATIPVFGMMRSIAETMLQSISDIFLICIFLYFLHAGTGFKMPSYGLFGRIDRGVRSYLITKTFVSLIVGFLSWAILALFQLDMAPMFGFLAFLLNYIPNIGSLLATLLPLPIAMLQYKTYLPVVGVILIPASIHFVVGNIVEPRLLGHNLDLHPITVLLTLMFWGLIWGMPGMILATPLTVVLKIMLENRPETKHLAELMAGRLGHLKRGDIIL